MIMPMFPLGSVLFPGAVLPLQVFEPRYQALVADLEAADNRFGVVLIRRGQEVGGGDERAEVGTVAEVVRSGTAEDGRILLVTVGRQRIRVERWLDDDPYPQADVVDLDDPDPSEGITPALEAASTARRRLLALAIEMGADGQQLELDLPSDEARAAWALCSAAPLGSFDRQQLLEIDDAVARMGLLERLLKEQMRDLETALRGD
ncbi:MAG: LON peptidase substrate-binding domain-containing protein [Acidimicrobiia bacterium]|nr:LON peptidase substrate-binding domain-containing protein [Acidimicrobiia bacterium]